MFNRRNLVLSLQFWLYLFHSTHTSQPCETQLHSCDICNKNFASKQHFEKHREMHKKPRLGNATNSTQPVVGGVQQVTKSQVNQVSWCPAQFVLRLKLWLLLGTLWSKADSARSDGTYSADHYATSNPANPAAAAAATTSNNARRSRGQYHNNHPGARLQLTNISGQFCAAGIPAVSEYQRIHKPDCL